MRWRLHPQVVDWSMDVLASLLPVQRLREHEARDKGDKSGQTRVCSMQYSIGALALLIVSIYIICAGKPWPPTQIGTNRCLGRTNNKACRFRRLPCAMPTINKRNTVLSRSIFIDLCYATKAVSLQRCLSVVLEARCQCCNVL